jgi:hypothetical protein
MLRLLKPYGAERTFLCLPPDRYRNAPPIHRVLPKREKGSAVNDSRKTLLGAAAAALIAATMLLTPLSASAAAGSATEGSSLTEAQIQDRAEELAARYTEVGQQLSPEDAKFVKTSYRGGSFQIHS